MPDAELHPDIRRLIELALAEDIGAGDLTTQTCISETIKASGAYVARQPLIVAGTFLLEPIFSLRGGVDRLDILAPDGRSVQPGELIARVEGRARTLLECERVSLNFLQRLSGIATLARRYVDAVAHTRCQVLDTRKTTPGLRRLEKMAAAAGGVRNHRLGLWDAILIKNNHITLAGGVRQALTRALQSRLPVEIEVRTEQELEEALALGARHLLLDNLTPEQARCWIARIAGRAVVELSGNITLENIREYAEAGPDFISCGAITHSAPAVDISFRIQAL